MTTYEPFDLSAYDDYGYDYGYDDGFAYHDYGFYGYDDGFAYDDYGFYGPDTSGLDAMLYDNGGFYGPDTSGLDAMLYDNGGFYGPDTSWLQSEMAANFDPTNPYLTDAILDTNAYTSAVYDSTNQAWSDYITG